MVSGLTACAICTITTSPRELFRSLALDALYSILIPALSGIAFLLVVLLASRTLLRRLPRQRTPGRKCNLLISLCAMSFCFSCFYRALNIADEGAATCRGTPTVFNAPVSGRLVATIGEVSLVLQLSLYIQATATRLGATQGLWHRIFARITSLPFSTLAIAAVAEMSSWTGVLSGNSKFYCVEYVFWMVIAVAWAWDAAELLHKSSAWSDVVANACLLLGGVGLFVFNAFHEIPHFFRYHREGTVTEHVPGLWECVQEHDSPLWLKRLPFFVCYFVGCSWCSLTLAYKFHLTTIALKSRKQRAMHQTASPTRSTNQ